MFRNWFRAAWGDLVRSPVQSIIAIGGLAVGIAAVILAGIVAQNQFSYDHFVPGHDRLYFAEIEEKGQEGDFFNLYTPHDLAAYFRQGYPEISGAARIADGSLPSGTGIFSNGDIQAREKFYWADPDFFRLMPLPVLYGDLGSAMARPDNIVIPLQAARKYFGRDNVVGRTLELDHAHPLKIAAVIADLPLNATILKTGIIVSSLSPVSIMSQDVGHPGFSSDGGMMVNVRTLVQLAPGASMASLTARATALVSGFVPRNSPYRRAIAFERVDQLQVSPHTNLDNRIRLGILAAAALTILILAVVNFVNLAVARSSRRGLEVAIRKTAGAGRGALMAQFLGESVLQTLFALCVAIALVEWSLPAVNAFFTSGAVFDYWRDPGLDATLLAGALAIGVLAGAYPALILSSFQPVVVLKGWIGGSAAGEWLRQGLVALQFAVLIGLLIAAAVVFRQDEYATKDALRLDTDQMLFVRLPHCTAALRDRMAALPEVRGAACSDATLLPELGWGATAVSRRGERVGLKMDPVDFGFLELYGLKPLAGRFFRQSNGGDVVPTNPTPDANVHYVVNQTAARQLGYATPEAAIGQPVRFGFGNGPESASKAGGQTRYWEMNGTIIGVVRDFTFAPGLPPAAPHDTVIPPTAYSVGNASVNQPDTPWLLHIKLKGHDIPETLAAIDAAWKRSGELGPIDRTFFDSYVQNLEITVERQGQAFATFAGIAMVLACLGLFGVAQFIAARRTKEIGIRKAMGATRGHVVALLLWQFFKPVLLANVIAWPLAWWAMDRWLAGFADHVPLSLWLFPAAGGVALTIALAAVAGQAVLVARQKPVLALRYE